MNRYTRESDPFRVQYQSPAVRKGEQFWFQLFGAIILLGSPVLAAYIFYQNKWLTTGGLVMFSFAMAFVFVGSIFATRMLFLEYQSSSLSTWIGMFGGWGAGGGLAYLAWQSFREDKKKNTSEPT